MKKFNYNIFIKELVACGHRQIEGEIKAAEKICSYLSKCEVKWEDQIFEVDVPFIKKAKIFADGKEVEGIEGSCFVGGKIGSKDSILSSLISSRMFTGMENINFNPSCENVSLANHYFVPSVAVSHKALQKILMAGGVDGYVEVEKFKHKTRNILVGNLSNPSIICFAHYDSIKKGAIDNASGVSLLMETVWTKKELLNNCLFVFSAAEELSYDQPIYWGHGFRVFENKYLKILKEAKKIIVIDCIGNGKCEIVKDKKYLELGFPIQNIKLFEDKISLLTADYDKLMTVYHSDLDNENQIIEEHYNDALSKLHLQIMQDFIS